jgi:hypothetical protein
MAEGKNSIIVYRDWIDIFEDLEDDEAGRLIKHFFRYVNDQNPDPPDRLTGLMFKTIKSTLKRDLKLWEAKSQKNRENAIKRWHNNNTTACDGIKRNAKNADNDSDSDSVSDKVNKLEKRQIEFKQEVRKFSDTYDREILSAFYNYWSEPTKRKDRMRYELEKTWDTKRRLLTWFNRSKK